VQPDAQAGEGNARDADTVETTDGAPRKRRRRRRPVASESIVE
jgi:hypothetical protein